MRRILSLIISLFFAGLSSAQQEYVVGGDLSLLTAYEQAGDQWLDEGGAPIVDLLQYVHSKGWNAVRLRLFVDPSKAGDPAVCQDFDYTLALSKRVKAMGMKFLLDLHYSDTWADPSTQRIPAAWTDHSDAALARQVYDYTLTVVRGFIDGGAVPDYVQVGNEITYGLLWNTADGMFPSNSSQYAAAGYCPTWSATYSQGTSQWRRTASLLNNAAHAVRQGFDAAGLDSTSVKIVLHTEMGYAQRNSDNFYRHIRTAGFTDFDIIGLSYYPFWHGPLSTLSTLLSTLSTDFPDKPVHIVETAWYNNWYPSDADYPIAKLNSRWTANGTGIVNYLTDLLAELKNHDNATGLYYWEPEECGNGYQKKVMNTWLNRGLWYNSTAQRHTLAKAANGTSPVALLSNFLPGGNGVETLWTPALHSSSSIFDLSGRRIKKPVRGIYIQNGQKVLR